MHSARWRVVRWAIHIHKRPPFIADLHEGFNCGWVEAELVKVVFDHVKPTGSWSPSGSLPAEQTRVEVQDSPRRMVRWQAKHMSIPADPAVGSQRGGRGLSGKDPTVVSYKVDVNRKLILQIKQKSAIENDKPKNKCCKHNDNYLAFRFIFYNGEEKSQCIVCSKVQVLKACYQISLSVI